MIDIFTLYTFNGHEVIKVKVPHFNPLSEVIMWGQRVFILVEEGEFIPKYVECMVWVCPEGSEVK